MTRYFFHVRDADAYIPDNEGQELADLEAARREAINAHRELQGETLLHGGAANSHQIEIADDSGKVLLVVGAEDVLLENGHYRAFEDDATKSAPVASPVSSNAEPE